MIPFRNISNPALAARFLSLVGRAFVWAPLVLRRCGRKQGAAGHRRSRRGQPELILYYSQVVWQEVWQRPQEVALGLADYLPVVFISPVQIHRLWDSVRGWRREMAFEVGRGLKVVQPLIFPGEYKSPAVFALNHKLIAAEICSLLEGATEVLLMSNSPFSADLLDRFDWSKRVYDLIDDFPAFPWAPRRAREMEQKWLESADVVLTGTYALREKHRAVRPDARFVPSGVRFERFNRPAGGPPEDIRSLPRPILGYTGTVSDRLDRQLLERLCGEFRGGSVVLIGPVHGSFDRPRGVANLHLLGPRPHERLPAYVGAFDVALMPFAVNDATKAINPVKTLEYLAAGKVVVSTALPDVVRFYSGEVLIARGRDEFVEMVRRALSGGADHLRRRGIEHARACGWDKTVGEIAELIGLA